MNCVRPKRIIIVVLLLIFLAGIISLALWPKIDKFADTDSNFTLAELEKKFVAGLSGVKFSDPTSALTAEFRPWEALEQNRTLTQMLGRLCEKVTLVNDCYRSPSAQFRIFYEPQLIDSSKNPEQKIELFRGNRLITTTEITPNFLDARLNLMHEWLNQNQKSDGSFPYAYQPSRGAYPVGDNVIRQFTLTQGLFALSRALNDHGLATRGEKNLDQLLTQYYYFDKAKRWGYFREGDQVKLGAAALGVLAILESGVPQKYAAELTALGQFLLDMQQADGSFQTFYQPPDFQTNDRFYSGEALTALARLAEFSGEAKYLAAVEKSFPYYQNLLQKNWSPQYVPWHTQAYYTAYRITGDTQYAKFIFELNDNLITNMQNQITELPDELGRFYNAKHVEWGPPHSSSDGIYLEGLTYAYELANLLQDNAHSGKYRQSIRLGTRALLQIQWTPDSAYYLNHPERVVGAFKRTILKNNLRIDQIGHALNALTRVKIIEN
jgi:hypothetical protein